jgi:hypothetical protein
MATTRRTTNPARSPAARHTSEYHLRVTGGWRGANYAYPRGVGADAGKRPSYPLRPKARARSARARVASRSNAGTLGHVDNAIRHIYGSVGAIYSGRGGTRGRAASARGAPAARSRASASRGRGSTRTGARSAAHFHTRRSA